MAKILIVDDSERVRLFLQDFMNMLGHKCVLAEDGVIGFAKFESEQPDLIISDMIMPNMNGRDFIIKIRETEKGKKTPIIIISAYVTIKEVFDLLNLGGTYFMKKPVSLDDLKEKVERSLKNN